MQGWWVPEEMQTFGNKSLVTGEFKSFRVALLTFNELHIFSQCLMPFNIWVAAYLNSIK